MHISSSKEERNGQKQEQEQKLHTHVSTVQTTLLNIYCTPYIKKFAVSEQQDYFKVTESHKRSHTGCLFFYSTSHIKL